MELFFMLSAMLALIVPIAIGRVRCIRMTPRQLHLFKSLVLSAFPRQGFVKPAAFLWAHQASTSTLAYRSALAGTPTSPSRPLWRTK